VLVLVAATFALLAAGAGFDLDTPPTPPAFDGDPNLVTPGVIGFIITFAVAAITVLLVVDMVRRIRRVRYRAEVQEQIASETAAAQAPDATP
jgi:hypothetical protein